MNIANLELLTSLYGEIPTLSGLRLRSINVNWRGPTVTLRVDLPEFPEAIPKDWLESGVDTIQCHLQFLAVADLSLTTWAPPACNVSFSVQPLEGESRVRVEAIAPEVNLHFTSSQSVLVGHVSAFRAQPDGSDSGPHLFTRILDRRLHHSLPEPSEKTFYERL
ncbi:Imm50 family immunity protein [Streptomyces sp. NPDC101191]|uniref:Imm50 family immunity protein n=1 Tax=Streptomyces sp. NPDC101191 TaxID=3366126 RepID=UPI00382A622C